MKTMKEWRQGFNIKNISSFFELALGVALLGLIFICVNASKYRVEGYALMVVFSLAVAAIIIWQKRAKSEKTGLDEREEKMKTNLHESEELSGCEGGIDERAIVKFFKWMMMFFLAFCVAIVAAIYWKEIISSVIQNPFPASLALLVFAITVWLMRMQHEKERREKRYANKILTDRGIEPLEE
ncbi:hypothetical protein KJ761_01665 [Patescibacteria group bacterium]|nr:hypothetical protein [Patescibacteria group bacterium]